MGQITHLRQGYKIYLDQNLPHPCTHPNPPPDLPPLLFSLVHCGL